MQKIKTKKRETFFFTAVFVFENCKKYYYEFYFFKIELITKIIDLNNGSPF